MYPLFAENSMLIFWQLSKMPPLNAMKHMLRDDEGREQERGSGTGTGKR